MSEQEICIVFVHGSANMYGASRSLLRLASHLLLPFSPLVVLVENGPLCGALREAGIQVVVFPWLQQNVIGRRTFHGFNFLKLVLSLFPNVCRFASFLRKQEAAFVHTNNTTIAVPALAAALVGVPHIWHIRETLDQYAQLWSRFAETEQSLLWRLSSFVSLKLWPWYARLIYTFSDKVVCVSKAAREPFRILGLEQKVQVVYNGIEIDYYSDSSLEPLALDRWGQSDGHGYLYIGTIGDIRAGKGLHVLIRAFGKLKKAHPDLKVKCLIIGECKPENQDYLTYLQCLAAKMDIDHDVIFTGHISDPRPGLSRLDVCVLPSVQAEPLGTVVLEAMASRKPVIATATGGSLEQIEDGISGLLVPPEDADALASAIETMILCEDKRRLFAEQAFNRVARLFNVETHIATMREMYRLLLEK